MEAGPKSMLDVRVGVEVDFEVVVVCYLSTLFRFLAIECINMFEYLHLLS